MRTNFARSADERPESNVFSTRSLAVRRIAPQSQNLLLDRCGISHDDAAAGRHEVSRLLRAAVMRAEQDGLCQRRGLDYGVEPASTEAAAHIRHVAGGIKTGQHANAIDNHGRRHGPARFDLVESPCGNAGRFEPSLEAGQVSRRRLVRYASATTAARTPMALRTSRLKPATTHASAPTGRSSGSAFA